MSFNELKDFELDRLGDEQLIAYVAKARHAENLDAAHLGLGVFARRRWDDLVRRALLKVPTRSDAEDIAARTISDTLKAAFDGVFVGEAVNFINRILARRIADFLESRKKTEQLVDESDDEGFQGRDMATVDDETGRVELSDAVARVYARLESDHHRQVVDDYVFGGFGAKETAERVDTSFPDLDPPMSDQNVHNISSRFREDLKEELGL